MTYPCFQRRSNFTERSTKGGEIENRIVSEALRASRLRGDPTLHRAFKYRCFMSWHDHSNRGNESSRPRCAGHFFHLVEHKPVAIGIGSSRTAIARRIDARPAIQGIDHQARVVGQDDALTGARKPLGLEYRVLGKSRACFFDVENDAGFERGDGV